MATIASGRATVTFHDRVEAGRLLAEHLDAYAGRADVIVLALPRGGLPVAYEIATRLRAPLDIFLVRKLGAPGQPELAMGAIATGGARVLNDEVIRYLSVTSEVIEAVARAEQVELERREQAYRGDRPTPDLHGRIVILVDDGLAKGSSMRAAAKETVDELRREVDDLVCLRTPEPFSAVGLWYDDFSQTSDEEVRDLLQRAGGGATA
jgi:putative phosphoribosyl transferase